MLWVGGTSLWSQPFTRPSTHTWSKHAYSSTYCQVSIRSTKQLHAAFVKSASHLQRTTPQQGWGLHPSQSHPITADGIPAFKTHIKEISPTYSCICQVRIRSTKVSRTYSCICQVSTRSTKVQQHKDGGVNHPKERYKQTYCSTFVIRSNYMSYIDVHLNKPALHLHLCTRQVLTLHLSSQHHIYKCAASQQVWGWHPSQSAFSHSCCHSSATKTHTEEISRMYSWICQVSLSFQLPGLTAAFVKSAPGLQKWHSSPF